MMSCSKPLKILIADDHALTRLFLQLFFNSQPNIAAVSLACNGLEAVELAQRDRPDVVILDLQMPEMDGLSAAAQIKRLIPHMPIILFSSVENPQQGLLDKNVPVDIFLDKTVAPEQLLKIIGQLVNQFMTQVGDLPPGNYAA